MPRRCLNCGEVGHYKNNCPKEYSEENEKFWKAKRHREYLKKNKDKYEIILQKQREYSATEHRKQVAKKWEKENRIKRREHEWRRSGLKDDIDRVSYLYNTTENCDCCGVKLADTRHRGTNRKVMDHDHQSGAFRNIVCCVCNNKRGVVDRQRYLVLLELHRYFNRLSVAQATLDRAD